MLRELSHVLSHEACSDLAVASGEGEHPWEVLQHLCPPCGYLAAPVPAEHEAETAASLAPELTLVSMETRVLVELPPRLFREVFPFPFQAFSFHKDFQNPASGRCPATSRECSSSLVGGPLPLSPSHLTGILTASPTPDSKLPFATKWDLKANLKWVLQ